MLDAVVIVVLEVGVVTPIVGLVVTLVVVVDDVVPSWISVLVVVVVVWEAGGVVVVPVDRLPAFDDAVDGIPDDEVTVGGETPTVDIVVETLPELRAVNNQ